MINFGDQNEQKSLKSRVLSTPKTLKIWSKVLVFNSLGSRIRTQSTEAEADAKKEAEAKAAAEARRR